MIRNTKNIVNIYREIPQKYGNIYREIPQKYGDIYREIPQKYDDIYRKIASLIIQLRRFCNQSLTFSKLFHIPRLQKKWRPHTEVIYFWTYIYTCMVIYSYKYITLYIFIYFFIKWMEINGKKIVSKFFH